MAHANNVISFPIERVQHPARAMVGAQTAPPALTEIKDVYYLMKMKKAEEIMRIVIPLITQGFLAHGMNLNDMRNSRNIGLMLESIRSAIHGYFGLDHPLQAFAEQVLGVDANGQIVLKDINVKKIKLQFNDARADVSNTA